MYYKDNKKVTKPKQKKGIAFWLLFVLIIYWTFTGALSIYNFISTNIQSNRITASADTVESSTEFIGSNVIFPSTSILASSPYFRPDYTNFNNIAISIKQNGSSYAFTVTAYNPKQAVPIYLIDNSTHRKLYGDGTVINVYPVDTAITRFENYTWYYLGYDKVLQNSSYNLFPNIYGCVVPVVETGFNCDVEEIVITSRVDRVEQQGDPTLPSVFNVSNFISYTDTNGKKAYFNVYARASDSTWAKQLRLNYRSYLTTASISDSAVYQSGYQNGLSKGEELYKNLGYNEGYKEGDRSGFNRGYNEGILDSNNFTFLRLMTALVDAPISAISGLFNFEILGINMLSFVTSLFTVCIVILLVKLVIGGGRGG